MIDKGEKEIKVIDIENVNIGEYIRKKMDVEKKERRKEELLEI